MSRLAAIVLFDLIIYIIAKLPFLRNIPEDIAPTIDNQAELK